MIVSAAQEYELILSVLTARGARPDAAAVQARWLVEADLRGQGSHGLRRLPILAMRMERGLLLPNACPVPAWPAASVLTVDGQRGFGPVTGLCAVRHAAGRAREAGIVLAAVRGANHLGILAPYAEAVADQGMIGIALTTSEALVHPFGGRTAMVGTNPLAIAVPARPHPLVLDMATGEVSMGRILRHAELGEPIPEGWAVDGAGEPTTDAAAAAAGAISPFGGGKGSGLGLALEVLVAALTATALGRNVHGTLDAEEVCNKGDVFIVIDPAVLPGGAHLDAVSAYLGEVRSTPPQAGSPGVRVPGDRARAERRRAQQDGVQIPGPVWRAASALGPGTAAVRDSG
jgi:LDH2 family malate/lactate/ureidoglycolate dehydrogenase